jgi:hypothetical protein
MLNLTFLLTKVIAMNKSKLSVINGLKITNSILAEGDTGISFENEIRLAIYNRFELIGFASGKELLNGNIVIDVIEARDFITIRFEDNRALRIDMRDEAYTGPEAIQLCVPGEAIVIWN